MVELVTHHVLPKSARCLLPAWASAPGGQASSSGWKLGMDVEEAVVGATWVSIPDRTPQPMVSGYGWVPQDSCPQEIAYRLGRGEASG